MWIRIACIIVPLVVTSLDFLVLNNVKQLQTFQYLKQGYITKDVEFGAAMAPLVVSVFVLSLILAIQLELDNLRFKDQQRWYSKLWQRLKAATQNTEESPIFKLNVIRVTVVLGILVAVFLFCLPHLTSIQLLNFKWRFVMFQFVGLAVIPVLFIISHENLKITAVRKLTFLFPDSPKYVL